MAGENSASNKIFRGSYKGFPISVRSSRASGGKKYAKYSYPNRSKQKIQTFGLKQHTHNLTIVVSTKTPDEYFTYKKALISVLDSAGPGILVHPFFGRVTNAEALDWDITEEDSSIGYSEIDVLFEIDNSVGIPVATAFSLEKMKRDFANVVVENTTVFAETFDVDTTVFGSALDAIDKVNSAVDGIKDATSFINDFTNVADTFSSNLSNLSRNVNSLITAPRDLISSFNNLFSNVENLYNTSESTLKAFKGMFGFGDDDVQITTLDTPQWNKRKQNRDLINVAINVNALIGAYTAAAQINYETVSEINNLEEGLTEQYEKIVSSTVVPHSVKESLAFARVTITDVFNAKRVKSAELVEVKVNNIPASVLSYQYYGTSGRALEIALLNNQYDLMSIDGDITMLSE